MPGDSTLHNHRYQNLKSYNLNVVPQRNSSNWRPLSAFVFPVLSTCPVHFTSLDDRLIFSLYIIIVQLVHPTLIKIFSRSFCFQSPVLVSMCSSLKMWFHFSQPYKTSDFFPNESWSLGFWKYMGCWKRFWTEQCQTFPECILLRALRLVLHRKRMS
jgi:hypothetical protein